MLKPKRHDVPLPSAGACRLSRRVQVTPGRCCRTAATGLSLFLLLLCTLDHLLQTLQLGIGHIAGGAFEQGGHEVGWRTAEERGDYVGKRRSLRFICGNDRRINVSESPLLVADVAF